MSEVTTKRGPTLRRVTGVVEHGIDLDRLREAQDRAGLARWVAIVERDAGDTLLIDGTTIAKAGRSSREATYGRGGMRYWPRDAMSRVEADGSTVPLRAPRDVDPAPRAEPSPSILDMLGGAR